MARQAVVLQHWIQQVRERKRPKLAPVRRLAAAVIVLQGRFRRRDAALEAAARRRALGGFRVRLLFSDRLALAADARGRLTRLGAPLDGTAPGLCPVVRLSALSAGQRATLSASASRLQAFARWHLYLGTVRHIQRMWRGTSARRALRRHSAAAVRLQRSWRRRPRAAPPPAKAGRESSKLPKAPPSPIKQGLAPRLQNK